MRGRGLKKKTEYGARPEVWEECRSAAAGPPSCPANSSPSCVRKAPEQHGKEALFPLHAEGSEATRNPGFPSPHAEGSGVVCALRTPLRSALPYTATGKTGFRLSTKRRSRPPSPSCARKAPRQHGKEALFPLHAEGFGATRNTGAPSPHGTHSKTSPQQEDGALLRKSPRGTSGGGYDM